MLKTSIRQLLLLRKKAVQLKRFIITVWSLNSVAAYFKTKDGSTFEMWFHTEESFETLNRVHGYYETFRVRPDKEDAISTSLNKVLFDNYYSLTVPKNIEKVKSL